MEYEHNLVSIPPEINTAFEEDEEEEGEEDEEDEEVRLSEVKPSVEQWHTARAHTSWECGR